MARPSPSRDEVLENPTCQRVWAVVQESPGIIAPVLRGRVGVAGRSFEIALRKLVRVGLVHVTTRQPRRIYPSSLRPRLAPLEGTPRKIAQAVASGCDTVDAIRAATGLSQSSVSHHLSKLITNGLISCQSRRPYAGLRPTHALADRLSGVD